MTKPQKPTKGELTRIAITDAAIVLFAKKGFAETSIQDIANACGLSQSAIFFHFKNKMEIVSGVLSAIVRRNYETVASLAKPADSAQTRVLKHFHGNLKWGIRNREEAQVLLLLYYLACVNPDSRKTYSVLLKNARARIEELLFAAEREGLLQPGIDKTLAATLLHDTLVGSFVNLLSSDLKASQNEAKTLREMEAKWAPLFKSIFIS